MKKVVDIIDLKIVVHEVPDDYRRCSVTGTYCDRAEFMLDGVVVRINNEASYKMDVKEYTETKEASVKLMKSYEFRAAQTAIDTENDYFNSSMLVEDMIAALSALPKGSRVMMTQNGYYADGELASIFAPEFSAEYDGVKHYAIGHSSQNY